MGCMAGITEEGNISDNNAGESDGKENINPPKNKVNIEIIVLVIVTIMIMMNY